MTRLTSFRLLALLGLLTLLGLLGCSPAGLPAVANPAVPTATPVAGVPVPALTPTPAEVVATPLPTLTQVVTTVMPVSPGKTPAQSSLRIVPVGPTLGGGSKQSGGLIVWLSSTPNPPTRGDNVLEALVSDADGQPVSDATVAFDLDMTNMSHGKYVVPAVPAGNGRYTGMVFFRMGGPWRVIVSTERPGRPTEQVRFDFAVR